MLLEFKPRLFCYEKHRHWDRSVVPPLYKALQWPFLPRRGPFTTNTLCQRKCQCLWDVLYLCHLVLAPEAGIVERRVPVLVDCIRVGLALDQLAPRVTEVEELYSRGRVESKTHDFDHFLIQAVHVHIKVCSLCVALCRGGFFCRNVASDRSAFSHMGLTHFDKKK